MAIGLSLDQVILRAALYNLPGHGLSLRFTPDQNWHIRRSLKKLIERLDVLAAGQVQIEHCRPHASVTQPLDSPGEFGNPLHLEPLFRYGT